MQREKVREVASAAGCGIPLARDLLRLAGGDSDLVLDASVDERGVESVKAAIIDSRLTKIEDRVSALEKGE